LDLYVFDIHFGALAAKHGSIYSANLIGYVCTSDLSEVCQSQMYICTKMKVDVIKRECGRGKGGVRDIAPPKVRRSTGTKSYQPGENLNTTGLYWICRERRV